METPYSETPVQVMFYDTDCAAVVHNLAYLRFIELARTDLGEQLGLGLEEMNRTQLFPVLVRTEIEYKRPGRLGDRLVVRARLESVERSRFWVACEVVRVADGALLAWSRQMLALVQMPSGKPQRIPASWAGRI